MRIPLVMTLAVIAAITTSAAEAAKPPAPPGTLQRCLEMKARENDFSGALSITDHAQPVVSIVRGQLAGPGSPSIGPRTRFNLASMGKMFTAVAVGQLVDTGQIGLDVPVGTYVSSLTPEASAVTVRQLLTHSAGLGNFFRPENMATMIKARTARDLLPLIATDKPAFPPGSRFDYSNSGFALLGIVIEKVTGTTYGDYLEQHVFVPAGMTDTELAPGPLDTLAIGMTAGPGALMGPGGPGSVNASHGFVLIGPDGKPMTPGAMPPGSPGRFHHKPPGASSSTPEKSPPLRPAPGAADGYGSAAGGIFSTSEDLQRFAAALSANRLTSATMTAALTSKEIVASPASEGHPERDYGFGFGIGDKDGHRWFGHNGGTLGGNTEFAVFPDDQLTLSVLSNRDPPSATQLFSYARDLVLHSALQATCGSERGVTPL